MGWKGLSHLEVSLFMPGCEALVENPVASTSLSSNEEVEDVTPEVIEVSFTAKDTQIGCSPAPASSGVFP